MLYGGLALPDRDHSAADGNTGRYNQKIAQLREEAEKDFLTGLKTPRQFDHAFKRLAASAAAQNTSLSLLYIDIDHFKEINDRYGHACGDAVLKALGKILRKTARSQDIISRKGGEEFVMLLTGCTLSQAEQVAERLRQTVESASFSCSSHDRCDCRIRITLSIGVAAIPETTTASSRLLELADRALYRAKQSGRNRVVLAESEEPACRPPLCQLKRILSQICPKWYVVPKMVRGSILGTDRFQAAKKALFRVLLLCYPLLRIVCGAPSGTRTRDPLIKSQLLYQLS